MSPTKSLNDSHRPCPRWVIHWINPSTPFIAFFRNVDAASSTGRRIDPMPVGDPEPGLAHPPDARIRPCAAAPFGWRRTTLCTLALAKRRGEVEGHRQGT